jgi:hypothetical protein
VDALRDDVLRVADVFVAVVFVVVAAFVAARLVDVFFVWDFLLFGGVFSDAPAVMVGSTYQ